MYTQGSVETPIRKFEGLVARAQENVFLTQTLLRDIRTQFIKMRSDTAQNQKITQRDGTWVQLAGHCFGIGATFIAKSPEIYSAISKTADLGKAWLYDPKSYDNQTKMEEYQQELATLDMIHQTNASYLQSLESHKAQIDQRKQSMYH